MSKAGKRRAERQGWSLHSEINGNRSSMKIPCYCTPAAPHSVVLKCVVKHKLHIGILWGYDGRCGRGEVHRLTFIEREDIIEGNDGEKRQVVTTHAQPIAARRLVYAKGASQ